jgi:KaiC/GvpD/RAD55 family RecA-like ATPase
MVVLPDEVLEVLQNPGYSLLIRGLPGAGKTRLALTLLSLEEGKDGIYVSTRVDVPRLLDQYPGLSSVLEKGAIIDASETSSRTGELTDIVSKIRFRNLPDFVGALQNALLKVGGSPLVVIDPWELVPRRTDSGPETAAAIIDMCTQSGSRLVLVSESSGESYGELEYVVDGLLDLRSEQVEGRALRRLIIQKLRGTNISRPGAVFTLAAEEGAKETFKTMSEWSKVPREKPGGKGLSFEKLESPEGFVSTGIEDLNKMMGGGLPLGSTTMLEISDQVSESAVESLLIPLWLNSLFEERDLAVLVSPSFKPEDIRLNIERFVDPKSVEFRMHVVQPEEGSANPSTVVPDGLTVEEQSAISRLERDMTRNMTVSLSADGMERMFEKSDLLGMVASLVRRVSELGNVLIITARPSCSCLPEIRDLSRIHLRLISENNTPITYGVKPNTPLYGLEEGGWSKGSPRLELTRIS